MQVTWKTSVAASALHAAWAIENGLPIIDSRTATALAADAAALAAALPLMKFGSDLAVWHELFSLAGQVEKPTRLAERVTSPEDLPSAAALTSALDSLLRTYQQLFPTAADELILRSGPLRMAWEARGPGLMKSLLKQHAALFSLIDAAQVLLVLPVVGGAGAWHFPRPSVHVEGLLANPHAPLPEVVRLAWLLAQASYTDRAVPGLAPLKALVPTLAAAEEVELARCDLATVKLGLVEWRLVRTDAKDEDITPIAEKLLDGTFGARGDAT